jgi:hypothetical protein
MKDKTLRKIIFGSFLIVGLLSPCEPTERNPQKYQQAPRSQPSSQPSTNSCSELEKAALADLARSDQLKRQPPTPYANYSIVDPATYSLAHQE